MPNVSVIVPNYNHALYLKQRIDSILNQTYQDFELILLDDCSTDNSREILSEYRKHPKVSYCVFNEENSGSTFRQWNKGIELAKGEYIWIAESDDWAEPKLIETLFTLLNSSKNIGLAYCNTAIHKDIVSINDFAKEKYKKFGLDIWYKDYVIDGKDEIERILMRDCTINNASAVLFRRTYLLQTIPQLFNFRFSGDWFCYLQIASNSDIAYSSKILNNYRDHSGNVSKNAGYDYLIELFYIYNWLRIHRVIKNQIKLKLAFNSYISDIYSMGLKYNFLKDVRVLLPINFYWFVVMTVKLLKSKLRNIF